MGAYDSIINYYTGEAERNETAREKQYQDLWKALNNAATFVQNGGLDKQANIAMNRMDPPRAAAVNPNAPRVAEAHAEHGGPTQPHAGGAMELLKFRDPHKEEEVSPARLQALDQEMRMRRDMHDRRMEIALGESRPNLAPPGGHQFVKQNNVIFKWSGSEYLPV